MARLPFLALPLLVSLGACFDSDEKVVPLAGSSSTTGPIVTTADSSTSTSSGSTSTGDADRTCREAIVCVQNCVIQLQISMLPEPDFTCFLECEEGMTTDEVLKLFRLTECVTNECIDEGQCDLLVPSDSTSTGEGSSSSSGSTGGTRPPYCLMCVMPKLSDPQLGGQCAEFAFECD